MINTSELRIGNWVLLQGEPQMIDGVSITGYIGLMGNGITNRQEQIDPIPLTPEVLVKCGFIDPADNGLAYRINIDSTDELCWYMNLGFMRYQTQGAGFTRYLQHIKHIHQLQNWWYMHTNTELNFKP